MSFSAEKIAYADTGAFSKIVSDYMTDTVELKRFYQYRPDREGLRAATEARKNFPVEREVLTRVLEEQYAGVETSPILKENLAALRNENTFTVCTAHQPNIFTGHLYFIYKCLHTVRLAKELNAQMPSQKFVPVYYMGSEDADLEELGEVNISGRRFEWRTEQKGAVGRMKVDKAFIQLIDEIEAVLSVKKYGADFAAQIHEDYAVGDTISEATFNFVHRLFNSFGLVILQPDHPALKALFADVISKELTEQFSHKIVDDTVSAFPKEYKVQAAGRDLNLFYLDEQSRERIEKDRDGYRIANTSLHFSAADLRSLVKTNPEKFSPNVILRPLYQEMILPNVAFIGGGGELAYWLELKDLFTAAGCFFPVLMLRNSFAVLHERSRSLKDRLALTLPDLFRSTEDLFAKIVKRSSTARLSLDNEKEELAVTYKKILQAAGNVNSTLTRHADALRSKTISRIEQLEKKLLKAEKRKFEAELRQVEKLKAAIFPGGVLQERHENILNYLAEYGAEFLQMLYDHSEAVSQSFTLLIESNGTHPRD